MLVRPETLLAVEALVRQWGEVEVVPGDVTEPNLGLEPGELPAFDHVFHLAALYDLRAPKDRLQTVNVEGTRNLLGLLEAAGFEGTLHHVSSIAVAGTHEDTLAEDALDVGQTFLHPYHRSKYEAEKLVRSSGIRHRIYRPSAIVGHSQTGAMDRVDGPYYLFKPIQRLRDALPRWFPLIGFVKDPLNMVPVDFVADAIDHAARAPGFDGKAFHVVDPAPPPAHKTFNILADAVAGPKIKSMVGRWLLKAIPDKAKLAGGLASVRFLREEFLRDFGIPKEIVGVLNLKVSFDTTNLEAALQDSGVTCPAQGEYLPQLWEYWAKHLDPDRDLPAKRRAALAGKHVVITGASEGIGRELAILCAELGARPLLIARSEDKLRKVVDAVRERGGEGDYVVADLSDLEACDRAIETLVAKHGRIDVLVNNAARSIRRPAFKSIERFHDFERTMQLNFFAPLRLIRAALPAMRERGDGAIINVLTAGARIPAPNFAAYTSSKAALAQLTDTLATELLGENVHVGGIYLSWVRTKMVGAAFDDNPDMMLPREAAEWIVDSVVDRRRLVFSSGTKRRFVANYVTPNLLSRALNVFWRISTDDDGMHPEFAMDRMVAKRFIKGRLM